MDLRNIPEEHKEEILKMRWIQDLADREYAIIGPLAEWLQDENRSYEDIPPGLRSEVFYKDLKTGEIHACTVWKSLGHGVAEMTGTKWQDLIHPDEQEDIKDSFHSYSYKENVRVGQSLFRVRDSRGEYHWLLSSSAVIQRSEDEELCRYVGRDIDIGIRLEKELFLKRRIHEITDQSTRERALMEASGRIAGSTDENGLVQAINNAAQNLFALRDVRIIISDESGYRVAMGSAVPDSFDWDLLDDVDSQKGTELPGSLHTWHLGEVAEGHALILFANGEDPGPDADGLMKVLGPIILGAWERVRHLDTLRRHATTDPLTGAWNRRAFMQQAGRSLRRSSKDSRPCAVAIMDIDHFKKVNDEFGHPFGDRVLVEVAGGMSNSLRSGDFMCRWGGEEFALFLEGADKTTVFSIVDRIRIAAGNNCEDTGQCVSLSAGLFHIRPGEHESLAAALKKADEALLTAKQTGRDCTLEYRTD